MSAIQFHKTFSLLDLTLRNLTYQINFFSPESTNNLFGYYSIFDKQNMKECLKIPQGYDKSSDLENLK